MTSSPVQNCFSDAAGATIRIVKGEWDTSAGTPSTDPQPRLSVSIPSSQLQFQPYGYPPQVQLLSTSTSQYPSTEQLPLGGGRVSSSSTRKGVGNDTDNGNGNAIPTFANSPRTSSDRGKKHTNGPTPTPAPAASTREPQQARPSTPKENNSSHKGTTTGKEKAPKEPQPSDPETPPPPPPPRPKRRRKPTKNLTTHQIFYIFVIDGLGAMILSGAINFAIAYAMYTSHPASASASDAPPILLFHLPNSLAGDAAVTIILQTVITWLVEFFLVRRDLERGGVAPVGFVPVPLPGKGKSIGLGNEKGKEAGAGAGAGGGYDTDMDLEKGNLKGSTGDDRKGEAEEDSRRKCWSWNWRTFIRWFCFITDDDDDDEADHEVQNSKLSAQKAEGGKEKEKEITDSLSLSIIWSQILRALLISVAMFFLLWGPFVGVLMALGRKDETIGAKGDWVFDSRVWLPQVFKLILGGLLALLETPAFAFFWMVMGGWDFQARVEQQRQQQPQRQRQDNMGVKTGTKNGNGSGNGDGVVGMGAAGAGAVNGRRMSMTDEEV